MSNRLILQNEIDVITNTISNYRNAESEKHTNS